MSDPRLKEAMAEIKAVMQRHDIAGAITLVSPYASEFLYHIDPSWSVAFFEGSDRLRIRARAEDFASQDQAHFCVESTVHMICTTRDIAAQTFGNMERLLAILGEHFEIEHTPHPVEPHREH